MAVIVTADDNADIRLVITRTLERAGHTVIAVPDGAAALAEARSRRPDLVLLDGEMPPGMSGFEACRLLGDDPATAGIPVVMVTGSMPPAQVLGQAPRVTDVLGKPFTVPELTDCVRNALDGSSAR